MQSHSEESTEAAQGSLSEGAGGAGTGGGGGGGAKVDRIFRHCLHAIAIGRWVEGQRMPSVREAERLWSVNRLTVLRAYQRLVDLGLVRSEAKTGFFVAEARQVQRLSRHRQELDVLFDSVCQQIERETGLSPLGTMRYFQQVAEARASDRPECAFLECTMFQAAAHAEEIANRLDLPCLALTTTALAGHRTAVPAHVRTLFTTAFHRREAMTHHDPPHLSVVQVPIEISHQLAMRLAEPRGEIAMLGLSALAVEQIAGEALGARATRPVSMRFQEVQPVDLDQMLAQLLEPEPSDTDHRLVVLSTTLWEARPRRWRTHRQVLPIVYEIKPSAWTMIADAVGLPLGTAASSLTEHPSRA